MTFWSIVILNVENKDIYCVETFRHETLFMKIIFCLSNPEYILLNKKAIKSKQAEDITERQPTASTLFGIEG